MRKTTHNAEIAGLAEKISLRILLCGLCVLCVVRCGSAQSVPVIVVETTKGTFAFETYPVEAPKTVAHIVELVKRGFYDGQRIHRSIPGFIVQWGDPRSRDVAQASEWGRGPAASSGAPIGAAEMSRKHP